MHDRYWSSRVKFVEDLHRTLNSVAPFFEGVTDKDFNLNEHNTVYPTLLEVITSEDCGVNYSEDLMEEAYNLLHLTCFGHSLDEDRYNNFLEAKDKERASNGAVQIQLF